MQRLRGGFGFRPGRRVPVPGRIAISRELRRFCRFPPGFRGGQQGIVEKAPAVAGAFG